VLQRHIFDTSALVKAVLPEAGSDRVHALLNDALAGQAELLTLELALVEATNVLWKRVGRRPPDLAPDGAVQALDGLLELVRGTRVVTALSTKEFLNHALEIALVSCIPVYDSIFLSAAEGRAAVIVTGDRGQASVPQLLPLIPPPGAVLL